MTKTEFIPLVKGLKAVYADPAFLPDSDAIMVWYSLLKDFDYKDTSRAIQEVMRTSKFKPTVADIIERIHGNVADKVMTEMEAWSLVRKAVSRSIYGSAEEFEKLPPACQKAVGSAANLRELAMMDEATVESVEQSHFVKSYRANTERAQREERATLPQHIQNLQRLQSKAETTQRIEGVSEEGVGQVPEPKKVVDYGDIERRIAGMFTA